jgi:hypothetical protein
MRLRAIRCWHLRCSTAAPMDYLVLAASVVVFLGLCWLLGRLTRSASDGMPFTWPHIGITVGLCAASVGVITYLIW